MSAETPEGYLGTSGRIARGPAPELVAAGYAREMADAPLLHRGLGLADLAHVLALLEAGTVPDGDARRLLDVLIELLDVPAEQFPYDPMYGDAYNSRERELEERLGNVAGWLHTGRTRREAGRIAFRLALRDRALRLQEELFRFVRAVMSRAEEHVLTVWNDTTYLQPAQPSTFGHYLLTFAEEALRDLDRLDAVVSWADRSPAGVGGVSGTRIPLDRTELAKLLGFSQVGIHSRDVMWSIDGVVDAAVAAAQAAATIDRLAEDLEIFTSPQFGYVELDASVCRASVMLPQKRNPYSLSVIRAGANSLIGTATGLMATQRTPSARTDNWLRSYGETAGSLELAQELTALATRVVATLHIATERLEESAGEHFTVATDLADELVLQAGLDYRTSYRIVGHQAARAYDNGRTRYDSSDIDAIAAAARERGVTVDVSSLTATLDIDAILRTRSSIGGAAAPQVLDRIHEIGDEIDRRERRVGAQRQRHRASEQRLLAAARTVIDDQAP